MEGGLVMTVLMLVGGFLMGCGMAEVVNRFEGR